MCVGWAALGPRPDDVNDDDDATDDGDDAPPPATMRDVADHHCGNVRPSS
jgi:hypothetical protein